MLVAVVAVVGAAGAAGAVALSRRGAHAEVAKVLTGSLKLHDFGEFRGGVACGGSGGYSDLRGGASVTVKDGAGSIIGVSQLHGGHSSDSNNCTFDFDLIGLPDASVYQFEVAHRGAVPYTREQLEAQGWRVELSVG